MQTLFDDLEIIKNHRFMEYPKSWYLELQTIFPHMAKKTNNI